MLLPLIIIGIALMAITFWASTTFNGTAQAQPDSDNDGMVTSDISGTTSSSVPDADGWVSIDGLSGVMHKAAWKDLVVDVSLECGLYTNTQVKSKGGKTETSIARAWVEVQVLVEGKAMEPGEVVFCDREQELSAKFQGLLDQCIDKKTGLIVIGDGSCLVEEEIGLILTTTNANSFNFVRKDLPQGDYNIVVQFRITDSGSSTNGSNDAYGFIGKGSAIVHEVRFAKTKD